MDKEQILAELGQKIASGEITRQEVMSHVGVPRDGSEDDIFPDGTQTAHRLSMSKILYVLGGVIVLVGIVILVGQLWDDLRSGGRIAVTLGLGIVFAIVGSVSMKSKPEAYLGTIFHFLGGCLIPGGAMVTLYEMDISLDTLWPVTFTFAVISVFYIALTFLHKKQILTFFAIANGTAFVYLLIETLVSGPVYRHGDLYAYVTMVIGISYLLLSWAFRSGWNSRLSLSLIFLGTGGFLGASFSRVFDSGFWKILFFLIVFGGVYLSIHIKNRMVLLLSTLFLVFHITYITSEYFADSLGWPISLIILGFVFIGLGYGSISIGKKYITGGK